MKQVRNDSCEIKLPIEVDKLLGREHLCSFLRDSANNRKILNSNTIEVFRVTMHVDFPETIALLFQLVIETMISAIIT